MLLKRSELAIGSLNLVCVEQPVVIFLLVLGLRVYFLLRDESSAVLVVRERAGVFLRFFDMGAKPALRWLSLPSLHSPEQK